MNPKCRSKPLRSQQLLALALCLAAALAPPAAASAGTAQASAAQASARPPIEAVWAFNGGDVAIQQHADGTFAGIVDEPTRFALCSHPDGEEMWTGIRLQPDGSYWGLHQWFFESPSCQRNPMLGPAAWRVMTAANGSRFLLVCFSYPGTTQPTIAASGKTEHVTYSCFESARLAPVPTGSTPSSKAGVKGFTQAVSLPGTAKCFSRRVFQIHLKDPKFDPIKEVVVTIRGRRVAVVRRGKVLTSTINLRGLPKGKFTVRIKLTTVLGHHLSGSRTYHTCVPRKSSKRKPVRHPGTSRR